MFVDDHQLYTSAVREALEQDSQLAAYRYHDIYHKSWQIPGNDP